VIARKRHSDEDVLKLPREIEVKLANGSNVPSACLGVGISEPTYYDWRKRFGGMGRSRAAFTESCRRFRSNSVCVPRTLISTPATFTWCGRSMKRDACADPLNRDRRCQIIPANYSLESFQNPLYKNLCLLIEWFNR